MELIFLWLFFGVTAAMIASSKRRSGCGWFLLGILFGPLAWIVIALPKVTKGETPKFYW